MAGRSLTFHEKADETTKFFDYAANCRNSDCHRWGRTFALKQFYSALVSWSVTISFAISEIPPMRV